MQNFKMITWKRKHVICHVIIPRRNHTRVISTGLTDEFDDIIHKMCKERYSGIRHVMISTVNMFISTVTVVIKKIRAVRDPSNRRIYLDAHDQYCDQNS